MPLFSKLETVLMFQQRPPGRICWKPLIVQIGVMAFCMFLQATFMVHSERRSWGEYQRADPNTSDQTKVFITPY